MRERSAFNYEIFVFLAMAIIFTTVFPSISSVRFADRADEGYYLKYAGAVADRGVAEFRNLFTNYINNKANWVYPNPLRVGLIFISSAWVRLFGSSFLALAYLSFFSYFLFVVINYLFCSRVFGRDTARNFILLIMFSPISLAMSRRALSDSLVTLFLGLSIWLFLEMLYRDGSIFKRILFLAAFASSILIKETCFLFAAPFCIFLIIYKTWFNGKVKWSDSLYFLVYPAIIVLSAYIFAAGSVSKIIEVVKAVSGAVNTNQYAIIFGRGPWFRYIIDYMLLSPWVLILPIGYIFYLALNIDKIEMREGYFLVILLTVFLMFNFLTKNVRYVMILDLPLRLFSALMVKKITDKFSAGHSAAIAFCFIALIAVSDYANFSSLFLRQEIYDPITFLLLKARQLIP